jgi:hypothetical protein
MIARRHTITSNLLLVCALAALAGCSSSSSPECTANDDCPIDAVCEAGACVPLSANGEGEGEEGEGEEGEGQGDEGEGEGEEGEGEGAEGEGEGEGMLRCSLRDGELSVDDLPVALGLPIAMREASALIAEDIPVDVEGTVVGGERVWDFTSDVDDEVELSIEALPLSNDWWFADRDELSGLELFADDRGAYVAPLADGTLGVLEKRTSSLVVHAVASTDASRTFIAYDPPIVALSFPLRVDDTFSSTSDGAGTFEFNPFYVSSDAYESTVDAVGTAQTLAGDFPVMRVRTRQTVTVGLLSGSYLRYQWITPCLGVLADVQSARNEDNLQFSNASRVRRIGAPQ